MPPRTKRTRAPVESKEEKERRLEQQKQNEIAQLAFEYEEIVVRNLDEIKKFDINALYEQCKLFWDGETDIDEEDFIWLGIGRMMKQYRQDFLKEIKEIEVNIESDEKKEEKKENES